MSDESRELSCNVQTLSENVVWYFAPLTILVFSWNQATEIGDDPATLLSKMQDVPSTPMVSFSLRVKEGGTIRSAWGEARDLRFARREETRGKKACERNLLKQWGEHVSTNLKHPPPLCSCFSQHYFEPGKCMCPRPAFQQRESLRKRFCCRS